MDWLQVLTIILGSSVLSAFINLGFNKKKLHAEIIAKARIDWINEFRNLSTKYVYEAFQSINYGKLVCKINDKLKQTKSNTRDYGVIKNNLNDTLEKYNEQVNKMTEAFILIRLYLPNKRNGESQEEHKYIKEEIERLSGELNDAIDENDLMKFNDLQRNDLKQLNDYIGTYLKQEWDRAKAETISESKFKKFFKRLATEIFSPEK